MRITLLLSPRPALFVYVLLVGLAPPTFVGAQIIPVTLSLCALVAGAGTSTAAPLSVRKARDIQVVTGQWVPALAMRLERVREYASALGRPICVILALSPEPEMIGIHARRNIATVKNAEPGWNRAVLLNPHSAMCSDQAAAIYANPTVSEVVASTAKQPASASLIHNDLSHQAIHQRLPSHGGKIISCHSQDNETP